MFLCRMTEKQVYCTYTCKLCSDLMLSQCCYVPCAVAMVLSVGVVPVVKRREKKTAFFYLKVWEQ